jgi:hypothetical protein
MPTSLQNIAQSFDISTHLSHLIFVIYITFLIIIFIIVIVTAWAITISACGGFGYKVSLP